MVDEDSKRKAKVEFIEGLDNLCSKVDKDYQEIVKFKGSLEEVAEKIRKYRLEHEKEFNDLENDLFIPYKLADRIDICQARQQFLFSKSGCGFISIKHGLDKIKNSVCNECKNQLTKDNCYSYSWKIKNIAKWTIEQAQNFGLEDFSILFCSPSCFQKSIYYKQKQREERERERESKIISIHSISTPN